jgi:hypothetical protein
MIGCASVPEAGTAAATDASKSPSSSAWVVYESSESAQRAASPPRLGLATSFGETLESKIDYQDFKRGFLAKPYAVGVLYYNDDEGAEAMAAELGGAVPFSGGTVTTAKGLVDWGLKTPKKGFLGGYLADDKVILKGRKADRYAVVLKNNTRQPLEFVVSVDGLDVLDGEPASYDKRGYIVGPKRTLEIKGFRTSTDQVAAFRFGEVSQSYAMLRHQEDRNVGVIGVAVFSPSGKNPWTRPDPATERERADPFPAERFSIPPS